jgi:hypothetical protein
MKRRPFMERFQSRKRPIRAVVGVAWYTKETWAEVKAFALDPERFENSFGDWEAMAQETVDSLGERGLHLVKVPVVPDVFRLWLEEHHETNHASARATYAAEKVKEAT